MEKYKWCGDSRQDMQRFLNNLVELEAGLNPKIDKDEKREWLLERMEASKVLEQKLDRYKALPKRSRKRTYAHLKRIIQDYIDNSIEKENKKKHDDAVSSRSASARGNALVGNLKTQGVCLAYLKGQCKKTNKECSLAHPDGMEGTHISNRPRTPSGGKDHGKGKRDGKGKGDGRGRGPGKGKGGKDGGKDRGRNQQPRPPHEKQCRNTYNGGTCTTPGCKFKHPPGKYAASATAAESHGNPKTGSETEGSGTTRKERQKLYQQEKKAQKAFDKLNTDPNASAQAKSAAKKSAKAAKHAAAAVRASTPQPKKKPGQ